MTKISILHFKLFLIFCVVYSQAGYSTIREFETTRMKSTAGTGVGSILMDESTILNPAPIAFFKIGSVYLTKGTSELETSGPVPEETDNMAIIVSDAKSSTAGSFSFQKQSFGGEKRTRIAASMGVAVQKKSAMGITLRRTTEEAPGREKESYMQTIFGVSHAVSQAFTIGFVANDPFKKRQEDSLGIVGFQYVFQDFVSVMVDAGANYYEELSQTFQYRGAMQFKILDDFYARAGYFRDIGNKEKGTGVGLGWVQPRLVLEAALKNIEDFAGARTSESSFSLSYRF